jgi:predicted TPR repeat methyltransferase
MIPVDVESLLDLGCGRGIVGALCRIYRAPRRLVGLDAWEPYLSFCREHRLYDELVRWDLNDLRCPSGIRSSTWSRRSRLSSTSRAPRAYNCSGRRKGSRSGE